MTRPVLVVGGGTVGHLAPGFAVAEALRERGVPVAFATPGEAHEAEWFPAKEKAPHACPALRLPRSKAGWPLFPFRLLGAVRCARRLLREVEPAVVMGLGGWPCVPGVLAARSLGIPVVLVAADATPGVAVRRLRSFAARIYAAHADAAEALGGGERILVTGPILRRAALEGRPRPEAFGLEEDRPTLFVTGGSLGALALNRALSTGLLEAAREDPALARRVQVLHSVGLRGEGVAEAYASAGLTHHVTTFVKDMGTAYATADLVVCRAGALTCAELEASGRPAVLVPYPHHEDRQQYKNAAPLVERGGAVLVEEADLTPAGVRRHVLALLESPDRLAAMAKAMKRVGDDGAGQIATDLVRLLQEVEGACAR